MHKRISYGGIAAAIGIIFLVMSAYVPSGKAALLFAASVLIYMLGIITDRKTAFVSYVVTSLVSFFVGSSVSPLIIYAYVICFGNYPLLRLFLESVNKISSFVVKTFLYIAYYFCVYFLLRIAGGVNISYNMWILLIGGFPVFLFYDWLLPKTAFYLVNRVFGSLK